MNFDGSPTEREADAIKDANGVFDRITEESYFGLNLRYILAESPQEDRDTVRRIADKARAWREGRAKRRAA